ncbi:ESPR domain-containing protein [Acidaminococcus fermentans]|uniref:ESPR domain-containing protein n=1 Tax=Acidaminococcus fermentans TaxID=905 RepID=UPI003C6CB90D
MNRIYKVIWSKVRCSWVVVSEIARNHGKEHSSRKNIPGGYTPWDWHWRWGWLCRRERWRRTRWIWAIMPRLPMMTRAI